MNNSCIFFYQQISQLSRGIVPKRKLIHNKRNIMSSIEERIKEVTGDHYEWLLEQYRWFTYSADFEDNYECADNFRFADTSNPEQMDKLERSEGCCGSASWTFKHPSGKYYLMAWNYGH